MSRQIVRRLPVGAEVQPEGGVHFRVWAADRSAVAVLVDGARHALEAEPGGYFSALVATAGAGARYGFLLDNDDKLYPDPVSRSQPEGPHGRSEIVDPGQFRWSDTAWGGAKLKGQIITEIHIGTFTPQGTWAAAADKLPLLKDAGITIVEMMPIAEFPGKFGWGYDGVDLFAPTHLYGTPDDLRRFIDTAHALGIGVILDVVYNHFGPDGNYLSCFSKHYFTDRYDNDWGDPINFEDEHSAPVREFFIANAAYWIDEFHFDGLRLDATQQIYDASEDNILAAVGRAVRVAARGRETIIVGENEPQKAQLIRPAEKGGYGLDGLWNDDFHHCAMVALTGRREAYYFDYRGHAQELISAVKYGFLMQGQRSSWQLNPRGSPALDIEPFRFITFIENHDQVANTGTGRRVKQLAGPAIYRAMTALMLLGPGTPMLFQGQEFGASTPFFYFADHNEELARAVGAGRVEFLAQFKRFRGLPLVEPAAEETFRRCILDWSEREANTSALALHNDLAALRATDPTIADPLRVDGAALTERILALRFFGVDGDDRLLLVNLAETLTAPVIAEPLLAPPEGKQWTILWCSDHPAYGGEGVLPIELDMEWNIGGQAAVLLAPADPILTGAGG